MNASHILDELSWRGLIHQTTDEHALRELLKTPQAVYAGFDPTASSLHCGHLLPLMMLRRFQQLGHKPIALVGGATGMIGDPSGKSEERVLLSEDVLAENVAGMQAQMSRFLDFSGAAAATLVNNLDWMGSWSYIGFLRDVGKNFPVNVMLAKDSVKGRLEQETGLSYTEFSYMLLQAYDFAHLSQEQNCLIQIGGSDQWGNITAGIDLGRRMHSRQLFGLTCPLLMTSDGKKMGKTAKGAVWLDPNRTSPYAFYQYWINVGDEDVLMCLRFLTEIAQDEYRTLEQAVASEPQKREAQKRLASWMTEFVHGSEGLQAAERATQIFFGAEIADLSDAQLTEIFHDVPSATVTAVELASGLSLIDALVHVGLAKSKSDARRTIQQGGANINNLRIDDVDYQVTATDLASETVIVLRSGKKKFALLRTSDSPI
ncbi:tyrosine--tRNA ligase [Aureliella helgolandensis]|uniref:Tyrosine--tRNA ligase n=1 Tax=Aureliella helgolandensis TaxID=2527968 RepID=A0A518G5R7_9BACT|nr:tyrosine--tRNA ligase [Aureliella helgolandensis]QDV23937.1 Tyrosine--tRNA ligase 1 [Aureliella helgolandensis]